VDKARLDEFEPSPPPDAAQETAQESGAPRAAAPHGAGAQDTSAQPLPGDPYEEAKSDPVVQNLIRRGGQVTDVELVE
jgi:hypothetical protein